jgi:hypothetical protein
MEIRYTRNAIISKYCLQNISNSQISFLKLRFKSFCHLYIRVQQYNHILLSSVHMQYSP